MTTSTIATIPPFGEYAPITYLDISTLSVSLAIWTYVYHRAVLSKHHGGTPNGFVDSTFISNLHSVPLCALGLLSLTGVVPESVPLCWSISHFVFDLLDTIVRRDAMWFVHAVISLALNILTGSSARHRATRSVSRGFFTEGSTPFLNHWKKSKSYASFVIFFLSFTLFRIVWTPYFLYNIYAVALDGQIDYLIWPSIMFYLLQLAWYGKMCTMLVDYRDPNKQAKKIMKAQ